MTRREALAMSVNASLALLFGSPRSLARSASGPLKGST